jgi:hypothetical protein
MIRLEKGLPFDSPLPLNMTYIPSGYTAITNRACDPNRTGFRDGLMGVDLDKCGLPGRRLVPELGGRVGIGFKTFLHTPDADALFLDFLETHHVRRPDILVTDVGIWGPRGKKLGGSAQSVWTKQQEIDYNLKWIQQSFPHSQVLMVYERDSDVLAGITNMTNNHNNTNRISLYRKDFLLGKKLNNTPCGHGCAGPVVATIALQIVEWLGRMQTSAKQAIKCKA